MTRTIRRTPLNGLLLVLALLAALLAAPAAPSLADEPSPRERGYAGIEVDSVCRVEVRVAPGNQRIVATVKVRAVGKRQAKGQVRAVFTRGGKTLADESLRLTGGAVTFRGPLAAPGRTYGVRVDYLPDGDARLRECSDAAKVKGATLGEEETDPDGDGTGNGNENGEGGTGGGDDDGALGGLLPNTGGFPLWLLLLAVALVVAGAALLTSRRRRAHPA